MLSLLNQNFFGKIRKSTKSAKSVTYIQRLMPYLHPPWGLPKGGKVVKTLLLITNHPIVLIQVKIEKSWRPPFLPDTTSTPPWGAPKGGKVGGCNKPRWEDGTKVGGRMEQTSVGGWNKHTYIQRLWPDA